MLKLTVEAKNAEELITELLAAAHALSAGAGFSLNKAGELSVAKQEDPAKEEENTSEPTGRRSSRRGAENKTGEDAAQEPVSRRGRAKKEDPLVEDDEAQAALRAQIIADLQILADDENAHKGVQDALKRVGSKNVSAIPSTLLEQFNEDIQALFPEDKTEEVQDDPELRTSLVNDLKDLSDVVAAPENPGEDVDVNDTLKQAWADAGVKFRGDVQTDSKHLAKIPNDKLQAFGETVAELITKYFG